MTKFQNAIYVMKCNVNAPNDKDLYQSIDKMNACAFRNSNSSLDNNLKKTFCLKTHQKHKPPKNLTIIYFGHNK